jgi:hypothetical protein
MQAMTLGAIPVVTDTVGTEVYLDDEQHGVVLRGVRAAIWHIDNNTGILVDVYGRTPSLDSSLVAQMTSRIFLLLDTTDAYQQMSSRMMKHARQRFSGDSFSKDFWSALLVLYKAYRASASTPTTLPNKTIHSLRDCTLKGDRWGCVFESMTQPVRKISTGQVIVWELGGAIILAHGNPSKELNYWSVFDRYFSPNSTELTFVNTLVELDGTYFPYPEGIRRDENSEFVMFISRSLTPFPNIHSFSASMLKRLLHYRKYLERKLINSKLEPDIELMLHSVSGYNIIRYHHKFYAIPQSEGAFVPDKALSGGYSSSYSGNTVDKVLKKIADASKKALQPTSNNVDLASAQLIVEGFLGYNIIRFEDKFYAILQREGAFEYDKILSKSYTNSFSGTSLAEVQEAITMNAST